MLGIEKKRKLFRELERMTGVKKSEILSTNRKSWIVKSRFILAYYLRDVEHLSYPAIGEVLGRDHSVARNAVLRVKNNKFLKQEYQEFKKNIK